MDKIEEHPDVVGLAGQEEQVVRSDLKVPKRPPIKHGAFQIYTGEGKGKSTASLGLMLRALGAGFRVYYVRMLKPR